MSKRKRRTRPVEDATTHILSSRDKPCFAAKFIDNIKGRGVFATEPIEQGSFVLEYRGEFMSVEECRSRHYSEIQSTFLYEFDWQKQQWCIDASKEDGSLGRLVNDNHKSPNCIMKKVIVNNRPHLCLFAVKNIETGTELDYNYGDSKWPWRKKVTNTQTLAATEQSDVFPADQTSHDDDEEEGANRKVTNTHTLAAIEQSDVLPADQTSHDDNEEEGANRKVTNTHTLAAIEQSDVLPADQTSHDDDEEEGANRKVTNTQTLAAIEQSDVLPADQTSHDDDEEEGANRKVTNTQTLAATEQSDVFPADQTSHDDDEEEGANRKVTNTQTLAATEQSDVLPADQTSHDDDEEEGANRKEYTVRKSFLVDYTDTDETDESCLNDQGPQHDEVAPKLEKTKNILLKKDPEVSHFLYDSRNCSTEGPLMQSKSAMASQWMDTLQDFHRPLSDPDESIVEETDDEQSVIENVPKLRRTKSIQMKKIPDFSDALYDSSDDSTAGPSSRHMSGMASQRPRRGCVRPVLVRSDASSTDSGEEYVPGPGEDSTDSDRSLELSMENKKMSKVSTSPRRCKSSRKDQLKSFSQCHFKSSSQSTFKSSSQSNFKSSTQSLSESPSQTYPNSSQSSSFETSKGHAESTCMNGEKAEQTCIDEDVHESNPSVYVNPVLKKEDGSRLYNKKHHCFYCKKVVQKMSRHLFRVHSDEIEVAQAFSHPKNSKKRRLQLDLIRNKGNFEYNTEVLESQKGKLVPFKQPKQKTEGHEFLHCVYCYGLFTRRVMWRHFQVCKFKPQDKSSKPGKTRVQALCAFAEPVPPGFSDEYWKFINDMHQDKVTIAVKQDPCILEYGYRLFKKNRRVVSQHQYIRQKLRELGRLILAAKKVSPVKSIKELIKPEKYVHVVSAARSLAGFNDETGKYRCPSLARKVGHSLHALAMFLKSEGLKAKDKETVQDAEDFAQLYQESWKFDIASQALIQLDQSKWNSPQLLPFTEDVQILHSQLSEKQQHHLDTLKEEASPSNWKDLAKVTLAQVILFNRRREGEVSKMPLSVYLSRDQSETHEDVNLALTHLEQKLCKHFVRITIVGKRGRKVPVLLTPPMKESLDTLVEKREECGVLTDNGFLFALPHSLHHLRGSDCIRQLVHECTNIKNPKALTSTKLRKHIATLSTVLNLKTTELDQLADFLGHNIDVHRKHYRLPEGTLQLAKVSKVLLAMEKGQLGKYKGKSLDEIHIDPNETAEIEACSQEDMEDASMAEEQGSADEMDETSTTALQESTFARNQRSELVKKRVASITEAGESEDEDSVMPLPDSTSAQNQRISAKTRDTSYQTPEAQESEDGTYTVSPQESTFAASMQNKKGKFAKKRGKKMAAKRNWTQEESAAVQRHLKKFIVLNQVPGKENCQRCIDAEPALKSRDWRAVKYFIKNRICSLRRQSEECFQ